MIQDAQRLEVVRKDWAFARSRRAFIMRQAVGSSGIGGMPSTRLMDFANNLALVFAYSVLQDVLAQFRDEDLFKYKGWYLKELMLRSRPSLNWEDFWLVDEGRDARNDIAHRGQVLPRADCWKYVDAIENELLHWSILDSNDL